jgi:predicted site-specific integrase-resolvase
MKAPSIKPVRCAIYTRVSTEHGLDQEFNSLDAQHEAASAYIKSQAHAGWTLIRSRYDDGGYSGGSTDRPDLQRLLNDIRARKIDVIVVYKVDRLTRSLADFAKLVELFDAHGVSFVSVTQQFNTTTSMGRLTLNVLLSFAQFEREGEEGCDGFASPRGSASRCNSPFEGMCLLNLDRGRYSFWRGKNSSVEFCHDRSFYSRPAFHCVRHRGNFGSRNLNQISAIKRL